MPVDDLAPLRQARDWVREGHRAALATVVKTWGSAPRRAGAHLAIRDDGLFEGSVSGGCVEGDVITEAAEVMDSRTPKSLKYGVADAKAWEVGLACGGEIEILVQPVSDDGYPIDVIDAVLSAADAGRRLAVATGANGRSAVVGSGNAEPGDEESSRVQTYMPPLDLVVVGAVHISQHLVPIAERLGYAVRVIDPRGSFARAERFAGLEVDDRWPDEALAGHPPGAASAVVTLTHDPKLDDPALVAALKSDAFYIAALGSRRTHAARAERLAEAGFSTDDIARIHGPAGLDIGAANPAEIALSVAAEMVAAWRQGVAQGKATA